MRIAHITGNTGNVTGAERAPDLNKWQAATYFDGKRHCLGLYGRFEDAVKALQRGEEEYFGRSPAAFSQPSKAQKELGDDNE